MKCLFRRILISNACVTLLLRQVFFTRLCVKTERVNYLGANL